MYINRKQILNSVLENIAGISDKEYQKRVWIKAEGPECDSYEQTIDFLFDDLEPMLKEYKKFDISENQYNFLMKFYKEIKEYDDIFAFKLDWYIHPESRAISEAPSLNSPEWEKVINAAKEVLKAFNYQEKKD